VDFELALTTYKEYCKFDKQEKAVKIGTLLKNMQRPGKGNKQVFEYIVASVLVCKEFFAFTHNTTRGMLMTLQKKILTKKALEQNWASHNLINFKESEVKDYLKVFEDSPDVMAPEGCTDARLHDLEFFEDYVVDEHKNYISGVY